MSDVKTRKYRCNGCGEDRVCYLTTNQEPHTLDYMQIDDLKCVLDETNQTSYNWEEVQANGADKGTEQSLHKHDVSNDVNCETCKYLDKKHDRYCDNCNDLNSLYESINDC